MFFSVARSNFFRWNLKSSELVHTATCLCTAAEWVQEHCVSVWISQAFVQHTQSYAYGKMEYCNKLRKLLRSTTHDCLWKHLLIFQVFILTHTFYSSRMQLCVPVPCGAVLQTWIPHPDLYR